MNQIPNIEETNTREGIENELAYALTVNEQGTYEKNLETARLYLSAYEKVVAIEHHQQLQKARDEALAREKQLKQVHMMELDAISCMSLEQYVAWRDQRKQRPNHSELD